jgi:hypothetical protein
MRVRLHFNGPQPSADMTFTNETTWQDALLGALQSIDAQQRAEITAIHIFRGSAEQPFKVFV